MKRILIIEDDPAILKGLQISLQDQHYRIKAVMDGKEGFETALADNFDLILLDLMLPSWNGFEVCRELRSKGIKTPIIVLTSKKEEADKVAGLDMGADDYLTKPFGIRELLARMNAVFRRCNPPEEESDDCRFGNIYINFRKQEASKDKQPLKLSTKEYEILHFFIRHEDEVISRSMLLDEVWGYDVFPTTRTVDTFMLNLRKKIEIDPSDPQHIITIHKAGYKFIR